jgi:hypothetical protein
VRFTIWLALTALTLGSVGAVVGCTPPSLTDRLADAAINMNQATRFGRMDIALEHVGPKARDEFAKHHVEWGRATRIVDVELVGMSMAEKDQAEVYLTVSWQPTNAGDLRVTHITQRWKNDKGTWLMAHEERKAGDVGLLGERVVQEAAAAPQRRPAQFPTHVIQGN